MFLLILLGISLSMDAFSLSICIGTLNIRYKKILMLSIIVGIFHFIMPIIGMNIAHIILKYISFNPKYITTILFFLLGTFMIFDKNTNIDKITNTISLILFGFLVSIDSLVAGVGLDMIYSNHLLPAFTFSIFSFTFTLLGLLIGKYINKRIGNISKVFGGIILIALALQNLTK